MGRRFGANAVSNPLLNARGCDSHLTPPCALISVSKRLCLAEDRAEHRRANTRYRTGVNHARAQHSEGSAHHLCRGTNRRWCAAVPPPPSLCPRCDPVAAQAWSKCTGVSATGQVISFFLPFAPSAEEIRTALSAAAPDVLRADSVDEAPRAFHGERKAQHDAR